MPTVIGGWVGPAPFSTIQQPLSGELMEQFLSESKERRSFAVGIALIGVLLLSSIGLVSNADAAIVDTAVDGSVPDHCTLRDAVLTGTLQAPVAGCEWSGNTPNQIGFKGVSEVTLTSEAGGTLLVTTPTFIISDESTVTIRRLDDDAPFRLIESTAEHLMLMRLRLEGGKMEGPGAAVMGDRVDIRYSSVSGNSAGIVHGVSIVSANEILFESSTLSENDAWTGISGGLVNIVHSTISGSRVGVIGNWTFVSNSTIAHNLFGVQTNGELFYLNNSIVAENEIADIAVSGASAISGSGNLVRTSAVTLPPDTLDCDPALLPLADNGGLTRTYALGPASCAIDAGDPDNTQTIEYDQRSFPYLRNVGAAPDIGAYEKQAPGDVIFGDGFDGDGPRQGERALWHARPATS